MSCPNTNLPEWKLLVASRGENVAYALWDLYEGNVPESESNINIVKSGLKATNILQSPKADQFFAAVAKNKISGDFFWKKMQADLGIPKDQLEILKSFNTQDRGELISSLLANYSYAVEINLSEESSNRYKEDIYGGFTNKDFKYWVNYKGEFIKKAVEPIFDMDSSGRVISIEPTQIKITKEEYEKAYYINKPTQIYSNLTVPGGTNYTENEIATPAITPAIKGHAQFATDKGIGWFRSDEQTITNTTFDKNIEKELEIRDNWRFIQDVAAWQGYGDDTSLVTEEDKIEYLKANSKPASKLSTKTRRILELQSDLFQKGRDEKQLVRTFDYIAKYGKKQNNFLQLLNKDNNWVTFFVKSIIQDSAKKGYEKVLFPSGNTASKVEGHTTLEEFKKQKEDRIKKLERTKHFTVKEYGVGYAVFDGDIRKSTDFETKERAEKWRIDEITVHNSELNQLKQELERVETEGFAALRPIYNFYENTVANVLKKQGYSPKLVTDEYGNTWNEIEIVPEREQQPIYFQTKSVQASKASKETIEKVKKLIEQMGVNIVSLQEYLKGNPDVPSTGINALADTIKGIIAIAEGKEDVALTEEMVHVATSILEQVNPQLITNLISKISQYKIYNIVLEKYKNNKAYQLPDGKPNIRKIKKEAVDKLITEMIINQSEGSTEFPELMEKEKRNIIQQMWDAILSAFKSLYAKSEIDLFEEAAQTILKGDLGARYYRIKPGVQELFNSNPELANAVYEALGFNYLKNFDGNINMLASDIASSYDGAKKASDFIPEIQKDLQQAQQLYSAYLDTIFPDSKVKDIVYHGAMEQLLPKDGKFKGYVTYFTDFKKYAETVGFPVNRKVISAIIDVKASYNAPSELADVPQEIHDSGQFTNPRLIKSNTNQYDSVIGRDAGQKEGRTIAVFEPEQIHILGGKQDVEGFKSFIETAPAEFKGGEGLFFQIEENEKVNSSFNKFKDMNDRMRFFDATETEKRHYTYDGIKLDKTVTTLKGPKDIEQTPDNIAKKEWGTEGHYYIEQYIKKNLIDENGYSLPLEQRKSIEIDTSISEDLKKAIKTFANDLISSYKPGTRFLLETMVANLRTKETIGSKIDFIAFEPIENSKGEPDVKIDILDWKFTGFDTEKNKDVPYYSQKDWKEQMGEYSKMAYNLEIERNQLRKTRMIPFVLKYRYAIKGDKASGLYPYAIEIGKIDTTKETNIYLLPVATDFESTGNEKVDKLLASLRRLYDKMYTSDVAPEEKFIKITKLDQLSLAIRNLHLKLNFFPIYDVAVSFLNDIKNTIKEFENIDYTTLSKEELTAKLQRIDEYQKSANKFMGLDEIYLSHISKEDMSAEEKKLLDNFGRITVSTKRALEEMLELQKAYVVQLAMKEGVAETAEDVLQAERVISSLDKNFLETSKLAPSIIRLAAKVYLKAKSILNINFSKTANDYSKILIPLEEEARSKGKSAFDMIGKVTDKGLRLIKKLDSNFLEQIKNAKEKENKKFLLDNLDVEKYKSLVDPIIEKTINDLDRTQFSLDEQEDVEKREWRKQQIRNTLDITSKTFDGYKNYTFGSYYRQAMIEEGHYSKDYLEMSKSENALRVWNFFTALNEKAYKLGYLDKQGLSFFPLIEATTLQKMTQSGQIFKETKDFFKDMYTINPNEEQLYAKTDDETGELKRMIPKYFTRTNKDVAQLSKDLNKVGLMWIKALMEYETTKELEYPLLTMHAVEQSKGTLITDTKGDVIFEGSIAKEREENENAMFFQSVLDDYLYGITENLNSMGNILMTSAASKLKKDQEKVEESVISAKKALKTGDMYLRYLALGLKPLIGAANFVGANLQSIISSSGIYDKSEFLNNLGKVLLPFDKGINLTERALIDTLVPLTGEDPLVIKQRLIAEKKSYANYLSTWTFSDVMMTTNSFGEKRIELANALSMIDNAIVINGKILNAKQYLKAKDREARKGMSFEQRRALEKSFDKRVKELKEGDNTLKKLSRIVNDELVIEGVSIEELAKFRMAVIDNSRNMTGQMSYEDKMGYRRDTLFNSFMMFKGWIPKQLSVRYKDITKNTATDQWEYGRYRVFFSTLRSIGLKNITDLRDIFLGTDKGLAIINKMLEEKKRAYFLKTGKELKITQEEYQDLIREQVNNMYKELALIVGVLGLLITSKIVAPDDDDDDLSKNRYKYFAKAVNKISDELLFYVNPASADEMTRGSIIPSLGLLSKVESLFTAILKEVYYTATGDEKEAEKTYPLKYFINLIPVGAQTQNELLPLTNPEFAKEMGVRMSAESRRN